jgi:hypothetical protein
MALNKAGVRLVASIDEITIRTIMAVFRVICLNINETKMVGWSTNNQLKKAI